MKPAADKIKAVFQAALEKATPAERAAFLEEVCAGDAALCQRAEALLQAHDQPDRLLDCSAADLLDAEQTVAVARPAPAERRGKVVAGRFKLLERIGEGGMGTVWLAEQSKPVRRKVALKLIRAGMDSKAVLARFEAERQALAVMDHPNIAKVLDGGTTEGGRPFFVMEYVKGVPLARYCDQARLNIGDRLALFLQVCQVLPVSEGRLGVDHPDTLIIRNNLAMAYHDAGAYARCTPLQQRTYEALVAKLGDKHPTTLAARCNLGLANMNAGQIQGAAAIFERVFKIREARSGPDHPDTLTVAIFLGDSYLRLGQPDRAVPILERVLAVQQSRQPEDAPDVVLTRGHLANAYARSGQHARAIPLYEKNVAVAEKWPGLKPGDAILGRNNLANSLREAGQVDRAVGLLEATLKDAEAKLGVDHPSTLICRGSLTVAYLESSQFAGALPLLERNLEISVAKLGEEHPDTIIFRVNLAGCVKRLGDVPKALATLETAVGQAQRTFGQNHPTTLEITQRWCDTFELVKDWDRAVKGRQEVLAALRRRGKDDPGLAEALAKLGQTLLAAGRFAEAEPPLRESLTIRQRSEPDRWTTFRTQSMLGGALSGQKKYGEAEPLLLAGYEGLKQRAAKIPPAQRKYLTDALQRLVGFYDASGKPDEAARWRKELEKTRAP
jgi:tetratricopeptide (TPR) repeat protein